MDRSAAFSLVFLFSHSSSIARARSVGFFVLLTKAYLHQYFSFALLSFFSSSSMRFRSAQDRSAA